MYNRYVPQNDGSYSKMRIPDPPHSTPVPPPRRNDPPAPQPPTPNFREAEERKQESVGQDSCPPPRYQDSGGIGGFLRQLLPKNFDTGDLLIILLLLLMAGDSKEEQNTALLTLALYLFM